MPKNYLRLFLAAFVSLAAVGMSVAAPVIVPDQAMMRLDDLGLYEVGYALRGGPEVLFPVGWIGGLDSPTGAACQPMGLQNGKEAWLLHCPWRGKTGVTFQDFTLRLPRVPKITLGGATALRADAVGKSDGVTFRVFVDGQKRLDRNRVDGAWLPFALDLTPEAGKTVTVRFETDPGPHDNSSFDFALWGDRRLELAGFTPHPPHHPAPPTLDLRRLTSRQNGSVAPLSGFVGQVHTRFLPGEAIFRYQGADGTLEYHWSPGQQSDPLLGRVTLQARMAGDAPVAVPLAMQTRVDWTGKATRTKSFFHGATLVRTYSIDGQAATVTVTASLRGKSLVFDIGCDRPVVRALEGGDWGPTLRRQPVNIPYYSLPITFLSRENLFAGAFLDWTASQASDLAGIQANYGARTDGTRNLLRERLVYTAAWQLAETLPNIPNPPSPFRADLSHRVVLDIWGDTFPGVQAHLHTLAEDGIGPGVALLHVWQHGGYDNMLPQHVPANADQGGDPAMGALVHEAKMDSIRMALHENYVDYYPNYPGFSDLDIVRAGDGSRGFAWYNPGTKIQSFAVKPSRIVSLARTQSPEVVQRYGSDACYLDVHSAVPPWFHVDFEAGQPEAGAFRATWDAHRALWAYERNLHHGPVFGEGNSHWYWSGYLDGVEAQFGQGWRDGQGTSAPLLVDFDLLKIHPLQLNHGMGYYERWWEQGPNAKRGLLSLLDQYRMQEAAYGHEGFLGGEAWHDPSLSYLESHLMTPLTARAALTNPMAIDYWAGGKWLDTTATVKSGGDWSRVRVRYANGLTVWANSSKTPLRVGAVTLPQYGWLAQGNGLNAGTSLHGGVVSDMAETPDSVFVNARAAVDWGMPGQTRLRPQVAQFVPTGPRTFRATYRWTVGQALPADYQCFVHFVSAVGGDGGENIRFQQDHALPRPTTQWRMGETVADGPWTITVPADVVAGDYLWTIGLFEPGGGRLTLQGRSDQHSRIVLGTLRVAADGSVTFTPTPGEAGENSPVNLKDRVLDFGSIRTNGSVFVRREGPNWVLRPFPRDRAFPVELSAARFGHPAAVTVRNGWWRLPLTGAAVYRWPMPRGR